jgi:hypothetical protein
MADQGQLAQAMAQIAQALQALQAQQQPLPAPVRQPVLELFDASSAFDLSSRAGNAAYAKACSGLEEKWDGSIEKFPSLITGLRDRAIEAKWNAAAPHGILTYVVDATDHSLLEGYHSIPLATLETARVARVNDRAIQNSKAFYHCLKSTLEGDIKATLFNQIGNLPTIEDGAVLFKTLTNFSLASSLQLTIKTVADIQALDPVDFKFNITAINTKLTHYFILASSGSRPLSESEKLQHTLSTYAKIKQPDSWAQWTRAKIDAFDENNLTTSQKLMNDATLKHLKIVSEDGTFRGRSTTVSEDVVAMLATHKTKSASGTAKSTSGASKSTSDTERKLPPFSTYWKAPDSEGGAKYKVGDTQMFEGRKYYFCDAPTHRNKLKWHVHSAESCRNRKAWLKDKPPIALVGDTAGIATDTSTIAGSTAPSTNASAAPSVPDDVTVLLASCLERSEDNPLLQALLGDALNAAESLL